MSEETKKGPRKWRRFWGFALLIAVFLLFSSLFRHILIPFILALIVVYLIEPIVSRLNKLHVGKRNLPRWACVIIIYLCFAGGATVLGLIVVPPLAREFSSLAEEAPRFLEEVRTQKIPEWNRELQRLADRFFPEELAESHVNAARQEVHNAIAFAEGTALIIGAMTPEERQIYLMGGASLTVESLAPPVESDASLRIRFDDTTSEWLVTLDQIELVPSSEVEGGFVLRQPLDEDETTPTGFNFDLETSMNDALTGVVEVSGQGLTHLLTVGQDLVVALLGAFVGLILTLMIGAFISIDLPSIMDYFRSLLPEPSRASYDNLLKNMDKGLAGVVRGQLLICLINGTLTAIGLLMFNVKFALILALFAGILSLIPIFGTIISTIPAVGMALIQGVSVALLVLGWVLLIHFIEANILNPKIIGTSAHIHPVVVVFALLAGEHTFGLIGALLAVPVASIFLTLLKFVLERLVTDQQPAEKGAT